MSRNPFCPSPRPAVFRRALALAVLGGLLGPGTLLVPPQAAALQVTGLQAPESFLADPAGEGYYISNANGDPDVKDNNGFITKLDKAGAIAKLQFIRGGDKDIVLHAPKGMVIVDQVLYVADLDTVRGFDKTSGKPVLTLAFPSRQNGQATALAAVAYDGRGRLYVSDTEADTIFRVDLAKPPGTGISVLVRDSALAGPRGLAVHPKTGHLIVGSWNKGKILEVTPEGKVSELVSNGFFSARFHNLDGMDFDSWGNLYVSDFTAGKIWRMRPDQHFDVIAEYLPSPAGIGIDRENHLILVPYHYGNAAEMNGLEAPVKSGKKKRTLADYGFSGPQSLQDAEAAKKDQAK